MSSDYEDCNISLNDDAISANVSDYNLLDNNSYYNSQPLNTAMPKFIDDIQKDAEKRSELILSVHSLQLSDSSKDEIFKEKDPQEQPEIKISRTKSSNYRKRFSSHDGIRNNHTKTYIKEYIHESENISVSEISFTSGISSVGRSSFKQRYTKE